MAWIEEININLIANILSVHRFKNTRTCLKSHNKMASNKSEISTEILILEGKYVNIAGTSCFNGVAMSKKTDFT